MKELPWHIPVSEWHSYGVRLLNVKRGISRHVVIFVKAGRFSFGIKEISEETSKKEIRICEELLLRGIHTLIPVGYVVREEKPIAVQTPVGLQYEDGSTSHTITLLVEKVLPDSQNMKGGIPCSGTLLLFPKGFLRNSGIRERREGISLLKLSYYLGRVAEWFLLIGKSSILEKLFSCRSTNDHSSAVESKRVLFYDARKNCLQ